MLTEKDDYTFNQLFHTTLFVEIFARIYFRAPSMKVQNSVQMQKINKNKIKKNFNKKIKCKIQNLKLINELPKNFKVQNLKPENLGKNMKISRPETIYSIVS